MRIKISLEKNDQALSASGQQVNQNQIIFSSKANPLLIPFRMVATLMKSMYFLVGWVIVITGFLCAASALTIGISANVLGLMNIGNGIPAILLAFGCSFLAMGITAPLFYGTQAIMKRLLESVKAAKEIITEPKGRII